MDKLLLTLLVSQAMNSARDVPNDAKALGKLGQALDLAVSKLLHVWTWSLGADQFTRDTLVAATFKVYAGQARECMRKAFANDASLTAVYQRADLILATAIDEFEERTTVVYCRSLGKFITDVDARAALCLGFNVLADLNQAAPPLHPQLADAVKRLTPLVAGVIDA